ncbi:hypothetical protein JCM17823_16700 [Halorubrum gandharaense]
MSDDRDDFDHHDAPPVDAGLRAGAALHNAGFVLAAHEPWEAAWLPLESGPDERLLHGLVQFAAATHHAHERNWSGAVGCATGAEDYLADLGSEHRGLALRPVREWVRRIAADPEVVERASPPTLRVAGSVVEFADLDFEGVLLAAPALAEALGEETLGDVDAETVTLAAEFAREERGTGRTDFTELLFALCEAPGARPQVAARLADRVERKQRKREDVDGLF